MKALSPQQRPGIETGKQKLEINDAALSGPSNILYPRYLRRGHQEPLSQRLSRARMLGIIFQGGAKFLHRFLAPASLQQSTAELVMRLRPLGCQLQRLAEAADGRRGIALLQLRAGQVEVRLAQFGIDRQGLAKMFDCGVVFVLPCQQNSGADLTQGHVVIYLRLLELPHLCELLPRSLRIALLPLKVGQSIPCLDQIRIDSYRDFKSSL